MTSSLDEFLTERVTSKKPHTFRDKTGEQKKRRHPNLKKAFIKAFTAKKRLDRLKCCWECKQSEHVHRDGTKESLEFQVDHINGNCFDDRPKNLQWLCTHCHAVKTREQEALRRQGKLT